MSKAATSMCSEDSGTSPESGRAPLLRRLESSPSGFAFLGGVGEARRADSAFSFAFAKSPEREGDASEVEASDPSAEEEEAEIPPAPLSSLSSTRRPMMRA